MLANLGRLDKQFGKKVSGRSIQNGLICQDSQEPLSENKDSVQVQFPLWEIANQKLLILFSNSELSSVNTVQPNLLLQNPNWDFKVLRIPEKYQDCTIQWAIKSFYEGPYEMDSSPYWMWVPRPIQTGVVWGFLECSEWLQARQECSMMPKATIAPSVLNLFRSEGNGRYRTGSDDPFMFIDAAGRAMGASFFNMTPPE